MTADTTGAHPVTVATAAVEAGLRSGRRDWAGMAAAGLLLLTLVTALAILFVLLADVLSRALPVFTTRGLDFLTAPGSADPAKAGVAQGLLGSIVLTIFVVILALPIGITAAIYLEEYAGDTWFSRLINTNIRNLAGVPAIVYGLLGLAVFVTALGAGRSLIAGGLTLAILVLPIVVITAAEALRAVPLTIREAAFGVGATRSEVVTSHVLPYAMPGILTGIVLTLARAFGETAPLIMVGAITGVFRTAESGLVETLQAPFTALPTIVYAWSSEVKEEFKALTAATIIVLLVVILTVNAGAIMLRNRYDRRW
ncbi:MAG TPA: phosphate ABC transporter permease PstA [Candidatus Limnocylindria bacterium]|nr:phosphate ABC transporter permease PstA [Candidatus Limnocylindria bacterium]